MNTTTIFTCICLLVFCFCNQTSLALDAQAPTTMLTYMVCHVNIWHLLFNIYALSGIASILEDSIGKANLISIFILSGLGAALCSIALMPSATTMGASGAILGLYSYAICRAFLYGKAINLFYPMLFLTINIILPFWLPINIYIHIGGIATGALCGVFHFLTKKIITS